MKKRLGYILLLYIFFCAVLPCTIVDDFENDVCTGQNSPKEANDNCNNCSPFSICSCSHGFTMGTIAADIKPALSENSTVYNNYYFFITAEYFSSHFQPPRAG